MLARPRVDEAIARGLRDHGVVAICAGAGMGKTDALAASLEAHADMGLPIRYVSLERMGAYDALRELAGQVRRIRREGSEDVLLGIDDVPAMDEGSAAEMAQVVESARRGGIDVVIAMRPDAELCVQALNIPCVRARELALLPELIARASGGIWKGDITLPYELTHDIPALVNVLCSVGGVSREDLGVTRAYEEAIARLVRCAAEEELMDEERRQRMAMLLLGRGSFGDIARVCGELDPDVAIALQRDEPLFGVDAITGTFEVAGMSRNDTALSCRPVLKELVAGMDAEVRACADLLAERGDFERAGLVAECCPNRADELGFILSWPIELLNVGLVSSVEEAALEAVDDEGHAFGKAVAEAALACIDLDDGGLDGLSLDLPAPASPREQVMTRQVRLMGVARGLCEGRREAVEACDVDERDPISRQLALHIRVVERLLDGEFRAAFRLLLIGGETSGAATLAQALLEDDFAVARVMVGDEDDGPKDDGDRVNDLLVDAGLRTWAGYHSAMMSVLPLLVGDPATPVGLACNLGKAERTDQCLLACVLGLGSCLLDLRERLTARAHVRATRVAELALRCGSASLLSAARLAEGVAQGQAGDVRALEDLFDMGERWAEAHPADLEAEDGEETPSPDMLPSSRLGMLACRIAGLASAAMSFDEDRLLGRCMRLTNDDLPVDGIGLLRLAISAAGDGSRLLRGSLPAGWTARLVAFEGLPKEDDGVEALPPEGSPRELSLIQERREPDLLRICMLGSFQVTRGGVLVPERSWRRQASRLMLMLLVVAKGHSAERVSLMEAIWPEVDYLSGRGRIYTALSTLRRSLGTTSQGTSYILGHGPEICLDPEHVSCDIDDLRRATGAMCAQDHGDDWKVRACRMVSSIYGGDLYLPPTDATGVFMRCRNELRQDYVDAMVIGSEAALRLGDAHEAVRFAELACREEPAREDAITAWVRALIAVGRASEARDVYRHHALRVVEKTGVPPSPGLRRAIARIDAGLGDMGSLPAGSHGIVARRMAPDAVITGVTDVMGAMGAAYELPCEEPRRKGA